MSELPQQPQIDQFDSGAHLLPSTVDKLDQWVSQTIDNLTESDNQEVSDAAPGKPKALRRQNSAPDTVPSDLPLYRDDWLTNARSLDLPFCPTALLRSNCKDPQTNQPSKYSSTSDYSTSLSPFRTPVNEAHLIEIARMETATHKTLKWLAGHLNPEVRAAVAGNRKTAPEILSRLGHDQDAAVRLSLVNNPSTPAEILKMLLSDSNRLVSLGASQALWTRHDDRFRG